jgi:hypothetical protein
VTTESLATPGAVWRNRIAGHADVPPGELAPNAAYDFNGLGSTEAIGRVLEIAATDALYLEDSIARGRLLISAGLAALRLIQVGELEARIAALEQARAKPPETTSSSGGLLGA